MTPGELTRDPRARREVVAAEALGIDVAGVCSVPHGDEPAPFTEVRIERVYAGAVSNALRYAGLSGRQRPGPIARELRGLYRLVRLAMRTRALVRAGRRIGHVDIVHANDLDTLPAGALLARRGARLVYDAHELYNDQETDPPRLYHAVAVTLERRLGRRADSIVTTAEPFAAAIEARIRPRRPPLIVLNAPECWPAPPDPRTDGPLRVVYYAAADHEGRPLDDLLDAAQLVVEAAWAVRVVHADTERLERVIAERGMKDRVSLLRPVAPDRLREALIGQDVGLILQRPITPNDGLASPNKLFEYMLAGLAVVAPDLPALASIVGGEGAGLLYAAGDARSLADAVRTIAHDRPLLDRLRRRARALALERYNAEAQRPVLRRAWNV